MTLLAGLTLLLTGCGGATKHARPEELPKRAAFDLNCPEAKLTTVELGEGTFGVKGCGQQATYVDQCNGQPGYMTTKCRWVMNSADKNEMPAEGDK